MPVNNPIGLAFEFVVALENGDYVGDGPGYLEGFALLIQTGLVWELQGFYGRMAHGLIGAGYITPDGKITQAGLDRANGGE